MSLRTTCVNSIEVVRVIIVYSNQTCWVSTSLVMRSEVTLVHLNWMKSQRVKIMISENVTTGNIGLRICQHLSDEMECRESQL